MLGLCPGGQVLAHALGAEMRPGTEGVREFGCYPLIPTAAGRDVIPDGRVVAQARYHEFAGPAGAELLARSAHYPHQAFRANGTAFGFQFHPEVKVEGFRRWQDEVAARHDPARHAWFLGFLDGRFGQPDEGRGSGGFIGRGRTADKKT